jgi:hypothetical protein
MKQIEFSHTLVQNRDGVIWFRFKEDADLDGREMKELFKAAEKLSEKKPYLLVSDARVHLNISSEGRKVSADKNETSLVIANAVLTTHIAIQLTANFFIKFNKPHFHYKVFSSENEALKWLLAFKPTN